MTLRHLTFLVCMVLTANYALAHPGIGLVSDSKGTVFYTDLVHVWRITPAGNRTIAVRNVHTHELMLDNAGNLYGEDLQYEGEATNRWHYRLWKRTPSGKVIDLVGQQPGFRDKNGFVQDRQGNQYWLQTDQEKSVIKKRTRQGKVSTIDSQLPTGRYTWLALSQDERHLLITDSRTLYQVDQGNGSMTRLFSDTSHDHAFMGIWPDPMGSIYFADFTGRTINRVATNGQVEVVARTQLPWSPSSMLTTPDGSLWILEYSTTNHARVRRIARDGKSRVY